MARHAATHCQSNLHAIRSQAKQLRNDDGSERYFALLDMEFGGCGTLIAEGDFRSVKIIQRSENRSLAEEGEGGKVLFLSSSDL